MDREQRYLVKRMRNAQKEYFRTRERWLIESKKLEKKVDDMLNEEEDNQKDMFKNE